MISGEKADLAERVTVDVFDAASDVRGDGKDADPDMGETAGPIDGEANGDIDASAEIDTGEVSEERPEPVLVETFERYDSAEMFAEQAPGYYFNPEVGAARGIDPETGHQTPHALQYSFDESTQANLCEPTDVSLTTLRFEPLLDELPGRIWVAFAIKSTPNFNTAVPNRAGGGVSGIEGTFEHDEPLRVDGEIKTRLRGRQSSDRFDGYLFWNRIGDVTGPGLDKGTVLEGASSGATARITSSALGCDAPPSPFQIFEINIDESETGPVVCAESRGLEGQVAFRQQPGIDRHAFVWPDKTDSGCEFREQSGSAGRIELFDGDWHIVRVAVEIPSSADSEGQEGVRVWIDGDKQLDEALRIPHRVMPFVQFGDSPLAPLEQMHIWIDDIKIWAQQPDWDDSVGAESRVERRR